MSPFSPGRSGEAVWLTVLTVVSVALVALLLGVRPAGITRVAWLAHFAVVLVLDAIADS